MKRVIFALLCAVPIWAAGTCTVSSPVQIGQGASPSWQVTVNCTGDASSGSFPSVQLKTLQSLMGGFISRVETVPGGTAPTNNYTETLLDANGGDELGGQGVSLMSSTATQVFAVSVGTPITAQETLNLSGNSVASATVTVYVYVVSAGATMAAVVAIGTGGGGGGGTGSGVTSLNGTANEVAVSPTKGASIASLPSSVVMPGTFASPSGATFGTSGTQGSACFGDASTNVTCWSDPASGYNGTWYWPATAGTSGQYLKLGAAGQTSWAAASSTHVVGTTFSGGGTQATQTFCCVVAASAGTIVGWDIIVDDGTGGGTCTSCTATVKFLRVATGTTTPSTSNSINTSGVALSTGTSVSSSTVTDFTSTAIAAGDRFGVQLSAVANAAVVVADIRYQ